MAALHSFSYEFLKGTWKGLEKPKWYHCDKVHQMAPGDLCPCTQMMAHPGNCTVEWEDGIWEVSPDGAFAFEPRLLFIHKLGGPRDVKLIVEASR